MTVISSPNHPLRLVGVLAASVVFFAIVAAAALAAAWVVEDQRSPHTGQVLGASTAPELPPGLIAVQRVNSLQEFEKIGGFKPFVPMYVPASTQTDFTLSLTFPDSEGQRIGRVGYSSRDVPDADGVTGPTVVLVETPGAPAPGADQSFHRVPRGNGRALVATVACQGLAVDVQLYFDPAPRADEPFVTPHMLAVAQEFLDGIKERCAS